MRMPPLLWALAAGCAAPAVAAKCAKASDCMYNGDCAAGVCKCDRGWVGDTCAMLDLQPAPVVGAYGYAPNVSSWGGEVIDVGGTYHMYVVEMVAGCGLNSWLSDSRIVHATSKTLLGPYAFKDEAVGLWSHGPSIAVDNTGAKPKYILWRTPQNTYTKTAGTATKPCDGSKGVRTSAETRMLHTADSPDGPWVPTDAPGLDGKVGMSTMPHAHIFPNGSIYVVNQGLGGIIPFTAFTAPSYKGPYTKVPFKLGGHPGEGNVWEDPFVWYDERRRVWKMLLHAGDYTGSCGDGKPVSKSACCTVRSGGLAYSEDRVNWIRTDVAPFPNTIEQQDGTTWTTSTRERPKLKFDNDGAPVALFTAVSGGDPHTQCKQADGVDYTFTHAQPIGGAGGQPAALRHDDVARGGDGDWGV